MAEQLPDPLLQALRSHGTHFLIFLIGGGDLLAAGLGFLYGATVGAWDLAFLYWLLTGMDSRIHRDGLSTILVATLLITLAYGLIYRLWTRDWRKPCAHMLSVTIALVVLWLLLEVFGVKLGYEGAFVQWIPQLPFRAFPNPFARPAHLWPLWPLTGALWGASYLLFTHRQKRSPRPLPNVRAVRIQKPPPQPPQPPEDQGVDPLHFHTNTMGRPSWVVDAAPAPKSAETEPQVVTEVRFFPLSKIHPHEAKWNLLEQCYKSYRAALERFRTKPIRRLRIPPQASDYESKGHIGWNGREPVFPEPLLHQSNAETLAPWLAHELAFYNGLDLWVHDLLTYYPNEVTKGLWFRILIGNFLVLPTLGKILYMPGWEHDRVKDGDLLSYFVGQGPNLKRLLQTTRAQGKKVPSSASLNPDSPTLSERIGQLEGLINLEHAQMREYGLVPPEPPLMNGQEQRPQIDRRTRKPRSPP